MKILRTISQVLSDYADNKNRKRIYLNTIFNLFTFALFIRLVVHFFTSFSYESWNITEWLINYQGGFVRRGLTGEILFYCANNFNINIQWVIKISCFIFFAIVSVFFTKTFVKKGYSLYILPLCFFLGTHVANGMFWHKRDHLMIIFFIATLWSFAHLRSKWIKYSVINVLMIIALLIHEAFAILTFPFLYLLIANEYVANRKLIYSAMPFALILPSICVLIITMIYHGNLETAQLIWNSWVPVAHLNPAVVTEMSHGALSSIGWTSASAFKYHLKTNFLSVDERVVSAVYWIFIMPIMYYISSNALYVFRKNAEVFTEKDKTILSSILIFQMLVILPIFTLLSCDLGRVLFYCTVTSFAIFILVKKEKIENLFPKYFIAFVNRINDALASILRPEKSTLALLMLSIGIPIAGFTFIQVVRSSVIYNILQLFSFEPLLKLLH